MTLRVPRDGADLFKFLDEAFTVHPTGHLVWKVRPIGHFKTQQAFSAWNKRYANTTAGRVGVHGYVHIHLKIYGVQQMLKGHHIVWALSTGRWPTTELDHINGNRSDNRIGNLRESSRTQNCQNRSKRANTVCRSKGVTLNKGKYQSRIQVDGVPKHLGTFQTEREAAEVYMEHSRLLFGEFHKEVSI